jgi:TatD DNase family protein
VSSETIILTDTHCHLDFKAFNKDREEVIERAFQAGIVRILIPGIDLSSSYSAIKLAEEYENVFAAVGVHPNSALTWDNNTVDRIFELVEHPKVVAIGEIGLDYYRDRAPKTLQRDIFNKQLEIAIDLRLPVIIHNRESSEDLLGILEEKYNNDLVQEKKLVNGLGVLHSFSGDERDAQRAVEIGFYIGITGPVTFKKADRLRSVVSNVPLNRILIETDAPFLTPHPYRGKRNEPAHVRFVAGKIAEIRDLSLARIAELTTANADRLFNWRELLD